MRGRIVACLPVAELPSLTVIATITVNDGRPVVEDVTFGGCAQSTAAAVEDVLTVPARWVDGSAGASWISIAWRERDDILRTGARTTLDLLVEPAHTEVCQHAPLDWRSWTAWCSALGDPQLSAASLPDGTRAAGHTTTTSAAMAGTDGVIVADGPGPPSLSVLRGWLRDWERAGRPGADGYRGGFAGQRLRLFRR
ncbi:hypothetical protein [Winogradskya humida]|uniref:Uncharacterized protein n=1 Tax=Winogradskya humida TaxID=113566 RepID=A0ABQ3ZXA6_9ACTN|nr:hypothetical protein [Actinoplanes humidus]GIE23250.1 hypothetical protein Ahu01nite_063520 [Actinoplanes humidus]